MNTIEKTAAIAAIAIIVSGNEGKDNLEKAINAVTAILSNKSSTQGASTKRRMSYYLCRCQDGEDKEEVSRDTIEIAVSAAREILWTENDIWLAQETACNVLSNPIITTQIRGEMDTEENEQTLDNNYIARVVAADAVAANTERSHSGDSKSGYYYYFTCLQPKQTEEENDLVVLDTIEEGEESLSSSLHRIQTNDDDLPSLFADSVNSEDENELYSIATSAVFAARSIIAYDGNPHNAEDVTRCILSTYILGFDYSLHLSKDCEQALKMAEDTAKFTIQSLQSNDNEAKIIEHVENSIGKAIFIDEENDASDKYKPCGMFHIFDMLSCFFSSSSDRKKLERDKTFDHTTISRTHYDQLRGLSFQSQHHNGLRSLSTQSLLSNKDWKDDYSSSIEAIVDVNNHTLLMVRPKSPTIEEPTCSSVDIVMDGNNQIIILASSQPFIVPLNNEKMKKCKHGNHRRMRFKILRRKNNIRRKGAAASNECNEEFEVMRMPSTEFSVSSS